MKVAAWATPVLSRATPSSLVVGLRVDTSAHEHAAYEVQSRGLVDISLESSGGNHHQKESKWQDHGEFEGHSRHTLIPLHDLQSGTQYQVRCRMKPLECDAQWSDWSLPSRPLRTCSEQTRAAIFSDATKKGTAWRYKFWSATASQWMKKPASSAPALATMDAQQKAEEEFIRFWHPEKSEAEAKRMAAKNCKLRQENLEAIMKARGSEESAYSSTSTMQSYFSDSSGRADSSGKNESFYGLGIDYGNSNSRVAVWNDAQRQVVPQPTTALSFPLLTLPSFLCLSYSFTHLALPY